MDDIRLQLKFLCAMKSDNGDPTEERYSAQVQTVSAATTAPGRNIRQPLRSGSRLDPCCPVRWPYPFGNAGPTYSHCSNDKSLKAPFPIAEIRLPPRPLYAGETMAIHLAGRNRGVQSLQREQFREGALGDGRDLITAQTPVQQPFSNRDPGWHGARRRLQTVH